MAKYDRLFERLCRRPDEAVEITFEEIEALVGPLPGSARRSSAWWSNDAGASAGAGGPGGSVQARAWLNAGREVERVEIGRERVRFSAASWRRGA